MLEAMACGTPVAAYPVPCPLDVVDSSSVGVLDVDLHVAAMRSLDITRECARARAQEFDWEEVCREFVELLVPNCADTAGTLGQPETCPELPLQSSTVQDYQPLEACWQLHGFTDAVLCLTSIDISIMIETWKNKPLSSPSLRWPRACACASFAF